MSEVGHLTKKQLAAYAADSVAQSERGEVGRHLLQCAICRDALPAPTPEQFWSALFVDETEGEESFEAENLHPARSPLSLVFAFFRQPLAWGAGALILVAGILFLIWLGASKQSNPETEVAQTVETPKTENNLPSKENLPVSTVCETPTSDSPEENSSPLPQPKQPNISLRSVNEKSEKSEERELAQLIENTPFAVSSLRPSGQTILRGDNKQNSNSATTSFALLAPVGETVLESAPVFSWEKAANAKSYRISILDQDFNEVLTVEVSGNSFKPDKPLNSGTKYLWRVEANTESGKIVAPLPPQPPAVFRVASATAESRIESLKKNENDRLKLAVFYAQEGMLDSARCILKELLTKNPKDVKARRLLAKVEQWQKENQTLVQRCGSPTNISPNVKQ